MSESFCFSSSAAELDACTGDIQAALAFIFQIIADPTLADGCIRLSTGIVGCVWWPSRPVVHWYRTQHIFLRCFLTPAADVFLAGAQ
jgi:hypothetical protein